MQICLKVSILGASLDHRKKSQKANNVKNKYPQLFSPLSPHEGLFSKKPPENNFNWDGLEKPSQWILLIRGNPDKFFHM